MEASLEREFEESTVRAIRPYKWREAWEDLENHLKQITRSEPDTELKAQSIRDMMESIKREKFW
jgi:hypothetical protein